MTFIVLNLKGFSEGLLQLQCEIIKCHFIRHFISCLPS